MNARVFFHTEDLSQVLPASGYYTATVTSARFRHSVRGNRMLHLALRLESAPPAFQCIADYFVLDDGTGRQSGRAGPGLEVRWTGGEGAANGIDDSGALVVETSTGAVTVDAGEVHLLR